MIPKMEREIHLVSSIKGVVHEPGYEGGLSNYVRKKNFFENGEKTEMDFNLNPVHLHIFYISRAAATAAAAASPFPQHFGHPLPHKSSNIQRECPL